MSTELLEEPTTRRAGRLMPIVPLLIAFVLILVMLLVLVGYYFVAPEMTTQPEPEPQGAAARPLWNTEPPLLRDEFAIQVRNEVLGGPYAVPETGA